MRAAAVLALASWVLATSGASAAGPLPSLPGSAATSDTRAAAGDPSATPVADRPAGDVGPIAVIERVRRGIVMLEKDGRLVGFGTVLAGDGRVLTALSAVGAADDVNVRYADGSVARAKVGHKDKAWDLALLVPHAIKWKDGLNASEADPGSVELRTPIPLKAGARPVPLPVHYKGKTDVLSKDGEALMNALDVELRHALPIAGAPIVDGAGTVLGVLVHACKMTAVEARGASNAGPQIACAPTLVGAPIAAVRSFLARTPTTAVAPAPWLGIVGQADVAGTVRGVRVLQIAPQSPAEKGGLHAGGPSGERGGDVIVAVDGAPVDTPDKLAEAIATHAIGDTVKLLVFGAPAAAKDGRAPGDPERATFHDVSVQLRGAP